jgi:hypothetical protein
MSDTTPAVNPLDALEQKYDTSGLSDTTEIELSDGTKLACKRVKSAAEVQKIERHVQVMVEFCGTGGPRDAQGKPTDWALYIPQMNTDEGKEIVRWAVYCDALLVEPSKMPFGRALKIGATCGVLLMEIGLRLLALVNNTTLEATIQAIETKKLQSAVTKLKDSGLSSGEPSTGNTPDTGPTTN